MKEHQCMQAGGVLLIIPLGVYLTNQVRFIPGQRMHMAHQVLL